jgi:hypothetical protein
MAGWVVFGGVVLVLLGAVQVVEGLVALLAEENFRVPSSGLLVDVDYAVWGWVHLALGVVAALAGVGLLAGNLLARVVAVVLAVVNAVVQLAFLAAHPVWSVLVIALDVVVIYAVVVHGRQLKATSYY